MFEKCTFIVIYTSDISIWPEILHIKITIESIISHINYKCDIRAII